MPTKSMKASAVFVYDLYDRTTNNRSPTRTGRCERNANAYQYCAFRNHVSQPDVWSSISDDYYTMPALVQVCISHTSLSVLRCTSWISGHRRSPLAISSLQSSKSLICEHVNPYEPPLCHLVPDGGSRQEMKGPMARRRSKK